MQRFSIFMFCLLFVSVANANNSAYLPVVDVSRGDISARAAFGEEVAVKKHDNVKNVAQNGEKKVVARSNKKTNTPKVAAATNDILKPNRPSANLWARNVEEPLRMPRMDEIAVFNSTALLPEESLDESKSLVARNSSEKIDKNVAMDEIKKLRAEIANLAKLQKETEEKIVRARPAAVRTPIAGNANVKPKNENNDGVSVRREIVALDTPKQIEKQENKVVEPRVASVKNEMTKMSPNELKKAFKKTYLSENKHLSTYQVDDRFDAASEMSIEGFSAQRDLSEMDAGVRPLEIKINFMNGDSGLSRENYNLLSESASIVVNNPKRAIQIAIPESATHTKEARKLASKRLAIVEQVLRDTGVADQRIVPVLSQRDDDVFVLRIISGDTFESLTQQKRNMFGDSVSKKTYKSMSW